MFQRIVLAVDLDMAAHDPKGMAQAWELCVASTGRLRLVNVQPTLPTPVFDVVPAGFDEERKLRATRMLNDIVAELKFPRDRVTSVALIGDVYRELLKDASNGVPI